MAHSASPADSGDPSKQGNDEDMLDAPPIEPVNGLVPEEPEVEGEEIANTDKAVDLEDLFSDDGGGDDDEFLGTDVVDININETAALTPAPAPPFKIDTDTMLTFYQHLFPFRYLFQWLNHSVKPTPDFGNREFALTLHNDAYLRYQSYATVDLFRKAILKMNPSRFEIGPVYNTDLRGRKTLRPGQMKPLSKELVFDIDLTDYDDVRTCCAKANICEKCWAFVTMAIKVIDTALREDFGFEHIMWVYSGRRGAHAWVCDQRVRHLSDDRRRAIAGYLEVVRGGDKSGKRVNLKRPLHPHISRSLEILKPYFGQTTLVDQDTFLSSAQADRLLSLLPDKPLNDALRKKWESAPDRPSTSKWADIDALAKTCKSNTLNPTTLLEAKLDIVLEYTYPRLDAEVSKKMIHLLKSPFVVHPGTGRVCVPIDGRYPERFNPLTVPTVTELLSEIDAWDARHQTKATPPADAVDGDGRIPNESETGASRQLHNYEKTRLKPYVDYFRSFIAGLIKDERSSSKRERNEDVPPASPNAMEF